MTAEKKYYPQLDAIRGMSFLAVFFFHAYKPEFGASLFQQILFFIYSKLTLSIDVFFVLSAFLLTLLGINEFQKNGRFSFKNYFIRRALRIWPLYYLLMFLSFVIIKMFAQHLGEQVTFPPASWYLFFVSNYYSIGHVFFLQLLWTLSVEEQFYLIWGFCLLLFQKNLKIVMAVFVSISIVFNFWGAVQNKSIYFHTLTYLFDMMAGAYAAYCVNKNNHISQWTLKLIGFKSLLFYFFLPIFFFFCYFIDKSLTGQLNNVFTVVMRFGFIIYCCLVIIDQMINPKKVLNFSKRAFLVYIGKISYGLYCFHGFVITFCGLILKKYQIEIPSFLWALILLLITIFIASISYRFFEKPFLNLKEKLARG
jgi:peptidoglycan/LPS O-acetylase OafA/YrhL